MRRSLGIAGLLLALVGAGASAAAQDQSGTRPPLRAHVAACETGAAPTDRFAVFAGSMPTADGVASMQMRFDLFERLPGAQYTHVDLPNWGTWEKTAKRGAPGFIFTKRVEQLAAPAVFRATVTFRWYDAKGRLLRSARRTSEPCVQPDPRPDLHIKRVRFAAKGPTTLVIVNRGRGDAPASSVEGSRTGVDVGQSVPALPAHQQTTVSLRMGRCRAGETLTFTLDPENAVDEASEDDNVVTATCP